MKKVLVTGAGGFLGKGMVQALEWKYALRLMDVAPFTSDQHEVVVGNVADLETVEKAMAGVDLLVIAHMFSRTRDQHAYDTPPLPFDANVKGTANLFYAAQKAGIKRVVLVSSVGVVGNYRGLPFIPHDQPPVSAHEIYTLTKVCQEMIAQHFRRTYHMEIAVLRPGGIVDADTMQDKYGKVVTLFGPTLIDRRDIGLAARLCLELPDLTYDTFFVLAPKEAGEYYDMAHTRERLGWKPQYDFGEMVRPGKLV